MPMNTANKLTLLRVFLIPVFLVVMYWGFPGYRYVALAVYVVACLTDLLDGYIARHYNQVSDFGKFADPLADKCLVMAALCCLVESGEFYGWILAAVLLREFAVSGMRLVAVEKGRVIAAGWSGKVKTAVTMTGISVMLLLNTSLFCDLLGWSLVNTVNQEITRMVIRGEAPDRAISNISKKFDVSRQKAGRLVMTESAYFSSAAQKDCYGELDVEEYKIVESLDTHTCELCGSMDGKVFKRSEYAVGLTAPPFHPWCRGCTCPHFADMDGIGERYARDAITGERFKVPKDMTYEQWRAKQNELYGAGTVEKLRAMGYNESADKVQFENYKKRLGADAPRSFKDFQNLKYNNKVKYDELAGLYSYKGRVPEATKTDYANYKAVKATGVIGTVRVPPESIAVESLAFNDAHGTRHGCTLDDAKSYVKTAKCTVRRKRWDGVSINCYSLDGAAYINADTMKIKTAFSEKDFDPTTKAIAEVFKK